MRAKILNASAGSGKTYQLAYQYVRDAVKHPPLYRQILAVTFTNKATEEMKSRILKEIHALASGAESNYLADLCRELGLDARSVRERAGEVRSKILHDYSRFTVLTIDTFFQRILRAFIRELGIDLNYNVEIETQSVLAKSADTLIDGIADDEKLRRWLTEFVHERIDDGRRWDVRDGILSLAGEIFKEKNKETLSAARPREELGEIVARLVREAEASKQRLRETAARAVALIEGAGCSPEDFTGKSRSFVKHFYALAAGELKAATATVEKMSRTQEGWCPKGSPAGPLVGELQPLLHEVCDLYATNLRRWNTCALLRENYRSFALLADLYARVQRLCDEQNVMLLPETKYILSEFIAHNDAPFIYEKVGNRYARFMIDEFQDTSVKEWENFLPLLENAMAQSEDPSVLLVGDIKQSIYRWRGGDWRLLHAGARRALGESNTQVEVLRANFRSLPVVVEFNNRVIGHVVAADNADLNALVSAAAARGDVSPAAARELTDTLAEAYRDHAQEPRRREGAGYVSVETFDGEPPVVTRICELLDKGFRPSDIMILVRSASEGARIAAELLEFKRTNTDPRHRFDVMTQEALVVGNAPVAGFVAAALCLALNPADSLHRALYNHYLGRAFDVPLSEEEERFFRSIRLLSPEEAFERVTIRYGLGEEKSQTAYLQALHEQIIAFCSNRIADIALFLAWWDEQGSQRSLSVEESQTTVEITTIHKAKGLEKRVVMIPYCSWQLDPKSSGNVQNIVWAEGAGGELGRFPVKFKRAMGESDFSEEYYRETVYSHVDNVNLLYVALTRAAESLHVFIPRQCGRSVGERLLQSIVADGERARIEGLEGRRTSLETGERFEFGEFAGPCAGRTKRDEAEHIVLERYPASQAELRLRLPSQRYFEQGEVELAPRNLGVMMHRAFAEAENLPGIYEAVERMRTEGALAEGEAAALRGMIDRALENPTVREWFDGHWRQIRNENEIVVPGSPTVRRPDRVMIDGERAVVVDYKFGHAEEDSYRRQMVEYMTLLRGMGHTRTEGYLWYVRRGEIEQVRLDA